MALRSSALLSTLLLVLHFGFYGVNSSSVHTKLDIEDFEDLGKDTEESFPDAHFIARRDPDELKCKDQSFSPQTANQGSVLPGIIPPHMADEKCKLQPVVLPVCRKNNWSLNYSPQFVKVYRCQGSCHRTGQAGRRQCKAGNEQPVRFSVSGPTGSYGTVVIQNHTSCSCDCLTRTCSSGLTYNSDNCQCRSQKKEIPKVPYFALRY